MPIEHFVRAGLQDAAWSGTERNLPATCTERACATHAEMSSECPRLRSLGSLLRSAPARARRGRPRTVPRVQRSADQRGGKRPESAGRVASPGGRAVGNRGRVRIRNEHYSCSQPRRANKTERDVGKLEARADGAVETDRCTEQDVLVRVASHLGYFGRSYDRLVDVLVGAQYGGEGKGNIAAYLASEYEVPRTTTDCDFR